MAREHEGEWAPGPEKSAVHPRRISRLAIASLALAILSIVANMNALAGGPAILLGILAIIAIGESRGRVAGWAPAICGLLIGAVGTLLTVRQAQEAARQIQCTNNLKQIGLALHNYHSTWGMFPPAYGTDEAGRPSHSWRLLLMAYLYANPTYNQYNFAFAWDHPANMTVTTTRINSFQCPSDPIAPGEEMMANYSMVTGPGTFFDPARGPVTKIATIEDGVGNTVIVVETRKKVPWTAPDDLVIDPGRWTGPAPWPPARPTPPPSAPGSHHHPGGFNALFADGSVRFVKQNTPVETLRALFTIRGGEAILLEED